MDDIDQMLQGQDQAPASPAQNNGQGTDSSQNTSGEQPLPEEVEFNSLTGSTQDRIRKLAKSKRELEEQLKNLERMSSNQYVPPAPNSNFQNPEAQDALRKLAEAGVTTDDKMHKALDERVNILRWEQEQMRLESKYVGKNDEPQYVREEVEDFIKSHPQYGGYAPEDVFKYKMFPDEFMNVELSRRGTKTGKSQTLRPTSRMVSQEQGLSPEYIAERTDLRKYPDALEWQEEHKHEIDKVLSQMQEQ
jgi:hypothetical protein